MQVSRFFNIYASTFNKEAITSAYYRYLYKTLAMF